MECSRFNTGRALNIKLKELYLWTNNLIWRENERCRVLDADGYFMGACSYRGETLREVIFRLTEQTKIFYCLGLTIIKIET